VRGFLGKDNGSGAAGRVRPAARWLQGFFVHHAEQVRIAHDLDTADFLDVPGARRKVAGDVGELSQVISVDQVDGGGIAAVGYASPNKDVFSGCTHVAFLPGIARPGAGWLVNVWRRSPPG